MDGIDLFDPCCPIEYVITVEALKEGWDCSFAYVFCSVSRIHSATDVEQLLGRVLRMPYAKRRKVTELNKAYAYLSEPSSGEAARTLTDKLVAMGFEEEEARDNIEPVQGELGSEDGLFDPRDKPQPGLPAYRSYRDTGSDSVGTSEADTTRRCDSPVRPAGWDGRDRNVAGRVDDDLEEAIRVAVPEVNASGFTSL